MATIRVTNQTQLDAAVKAAKAGDTVVLAAGTYKQLWVDNKVSATAITFKSESTTNPAVINYLRALNSDGVVFQGLKVGREVVTGVDQDYTNMSLVQGSKNVSFADMKFFTTGANDRYLARGIMFRDSANVSVKNSDFSHMATGILTMTTTGVNIVNNKFQDLRVDGLEFTAVKNVLIDGNEFRDFRSSYDAHADAIQFWTNGTRQASTDVVISNNVILPGTGNGTQGIFIQDEIGGLPYERITIKNNLLLDKGEYWNGITVRGGKDITIEGNTSISPTSDRNVFWIRLDNVDGVKLTNNLADQLIQSNAKNMQLSGNVFLNTEKTFASKISGINLGVNATADSLIVPGVGYQSAGGAISPVTKAPAPTLQTPSAISPIQQITVTPVTGNGTAPSASTRVADFATLQPSSLASTLTPIVASPTAVVPAAAIVSAPAVTPTVTAPAFVAPVLTAKQQKAAAAAAAAAAKAQAKAAANAAKAAAKAAKSNRPGTSFAVTPVVAQPMIPVAASPMVSFSATNFLNMNFGANFLGRSF